MEITKDKVTELFCIIDEFYKVFDAENAGKLLLGEDGVKRRRRKASLSDSEIMTILLYFHFGSFRNFLLLQLSHVGEAAGGLTVTFAARKIHITQQPGLP